MSNRGCTWSPKNTGKINENGTSKSFSITKMAEQKLRRKLAWCVPSVDVMKREGLIYRVILQVNAEIKMVKASGFLNKIELGFGITEPY